jgi:hypothetical protein
LCSLSYKLLLAASASLTFCHFIRAFSSIRITFSSLSCSLFSLVNDTESSQERTDKPDCVILRKDIWSAEQLAQIEGFLKFGRITGNDPQYQLRRVSSVGKFKTREKREQDKEEKVIRIVEKALIKRQKVSDAETASNSLYDKEHKCPTKGCLRVFRYEINLHKHIRIRACNYHGGRFCNGKKNSFVAPRASL